MKTQNIYLGDTKLEKGHSKAEGGFEEIQNERYYKISNSNQMADFLMTIVSDSDHWMYLSSNGSLSAGRKNRDNALFPYYTDDKIHDYKGQTGSKTILLISKGDKTFLWEPFSESSDKVYKIEQNLYKSIYGNKIIFEEINADLGIAFQYSWSSSDAFGFVRKSKITNQHAQDVHVAVVDGITNILPYGVDYDFQNAYSNLLDAYKKNELLTETRLGLFMLSSIPVDKAEPSESLKATSVWSLGLQDANILLSNQQLEGFKQGLPIHQEKDIRAKRGAYYVHSEFELAIGEDISWLMVADINQDSTAIANLNAFLKKELEIETLLDNDIAQGTQNLVKIVANADGLQHSNEDLSYARHFSNTLFNVMRGGIYKDNYTVNTSDFSAFIKQTNKPIRKEFDAWLAQLPTELNYNELSAKVAETQHANLIRICYEYLPLTFSRRHGDPSRPWNQFSIETKNEDGSPKLNYQGNWRDIFQNWEALSLSYPEYVEGIIAKFVNASTPDGYNPYRITREGVDWECPEPNDPWAYIGYWGDHQIIYLEKLLEMSKAFHPNKLNKLLSKEICAYANVPYRIKSFNDIVKNPQDTVEFDDELNAKIKRNVSKIGADARLLWTAENEIYRVNLTEKVLVTMLSKLSNFIPETGIWLNTQRPEWNDANNALVGNGVSMVTLYYLRRFLKFWNKTFGSCDAQGFLVSEEVKELFQTLLSFFTENLFLLKTGFSDLERLRFATYLGEAGSTYRNKVYANAFSGTKDEIKVSDLLAFTDVALQYMDQSIRANKRADGLYHSYNLIAFSAKGISVRYLYEMLEGQVAVLSAGYLHATESLMVLDALKGSKLFREDQYSYILYPDRELPRFTEKNNIPEANVRDSKLLTNLLADKNISILSKDDEGQCHFNGALRNADMLNAALNDLDKRQYGDLLENDKEHILNTFEEIFDHQSFTGRSGTFYGYEGLGSIYWHMVSKLLLAVQEIYFDGLAAGADPIVLGKIKDHYYEIKAGIGLYKSPQLYGAFPTDAYSHTPGGAGAKQPGMTGQVKEDVLSRMGELGVSVRDACMAFNSSLLNTNELLSQADRFVYFDINGTKQSMPLQAGQLAFTLCQVPIKYTRRETSGVFVTFKDGQISAFKDMHLDAKTSALVFSRSGEVKEIEVFILNQ